MAPAGALSKWAQRVQVGITKRNFGIGGRHWDAHGMGAAEGAGSVEQLRALRRTQRGSAGVRRITTLIAGAGREVAEMRPGPPTSRRSSGLSGNDCGASQGRGRGERREKRAEQIGFDSESDRAGTRIENDAATNPKHTCRAKEMPRQPKGEPSMKGMGSANHEAEALRTLSALWDSIAGKARAALYPHLVLNKERPLVLARHHTAPVSAQLSIKERE